MKRHIQRWLVDAACWYLRWQDDSNYRRHALREFVAVGYKTDEPDGPNRWIQENVLTLLAVLGTQGHSGGSIGYCVGMFKKLGLFEPLAPLTGEAHEWNEVDDDMWQNRRCSHVFKGADGHAYDSEGRIFRAPNGSTYTSRDSRVFVKFPYVPVREYVDVEADAEATT